MKQFQMRLTKSRLVNGTDSWNRVLRESVRSDWRLAVKNTCGGVTNNVWGNKQWVIYYAASQKLWRLPDEVGS